MRIKEEEYLASSKKDEQGILMRWGLIRCDG
jgi:hypothetical protein